MREARDYRGLSRDACESVINKRVAMLTVKSGETRARIDQITIGRHVERHGARAISVSNGRSGDNQSCRFVVNCKRKRENGKVKRKNTDFSIKFPTRNVADLRREKKEN